MNEIADGIFHWRAFNENIGAKVSSYYLEPVATVLDPMTPDEGLDWFAGRDVRRVLLTNRHHYRHADRFVARFDVPVLVDEPGLQDIEDRPGVTAFAFGDEVVPGVRAHAIDPSWPDEGAMHVALGRGWVAIADAAMRYGQDIAFVPDEHLGDDAEGQKELLRAGYRRLLDLDFDGLLFAHGTPIPEGGKAALRAFVDGT